MIRYTDLRFFDAVLPLAISAIVILFCFASAALQGDHPDVTGSEKAAKVDATPEQTSSDQAAEESVVPKSTWMFAPSYYTNNPKTGQRVTQYEKTPTVHRIAPGNFYPKFVYDPYWGNQAFAPYPGSMYGGGYGGYGWGGYGPGEVSSIYDRTDFSNLEE